ncbi:hypothetical protein Q4I32_003518, partial [Leishmania shawi]
PCSRGVWRRACRTRTSAVTSSSILPGGQRGPGSPAAGLRGGGSPGVPGRDRRLLCRTAARVRRGGPSLRSRCCCAAERDREAADAQREECRPLGAGGVRPA